MQHAVFNFFWEGGFRPVVIESGQTLNFDTGHVSDGDSWSRCAAELGFDGHTVTMSRHTEGCASGAYTSSSGKWTCTPQHLNQDTRDLGSVTVITPAWIDAEADYQGNIARG